MSEAPTEGAALLDRAYTDLGLDKGELVDVSSGSSDATSDWIDLAKRVGAQRLFFVDDDPVVVFSSMQPGANEQEVLNTYRRTWCLARPRCLFLAVGDELRVYALSQPPARSDGQMLPTLEVVRRAADVAEQLANFRRERLETGIAFDAKEFQAKKGRADERLLQDVRASESALMRAGLSRPDAHGLIERAILVRYLEDRQVLTPEYFHSIASREPDWLAVLDSFVEPFVGASSRFVTCLENRALTLAIFEQLARDFNGDLFVDRKGDLAVLTQPQLSVLQNLLLGRGAHGQGQLFLWAYDFSIVPTSLISSMYELFHRREVEKKTSTYYTPGSLVDYVLSSVLTSAVLEGDPVICDPACGSGVFLAEAFRRVARFEATRLGAQLPSTKLRQLLLERVKGSDIDDAAVRLAAFNLYLAFLDLQSPPDIREAGPLPPLIRTEAGSGPRPLVVADAFEEGALPDESFDVVVTNPPWTEPEAGTSLKSAQEWAAERGLPYGDNNPSQLFLWRALRLLREGGQAGLLISAGTLLNARSTSQAFRRAFLAASSISHVVALWPVRSDFFAGAKAPFAYMQFTTASESNESDPVITFDTARRGGTADGSLTFVPVKRRLVQSSQLAHNDFLWKTMSEGGRRDVQLILRLSQEAVTLGSLIADARPARFGWQRAHDPQAGKPPADELRAIQSINKLEAWGPIQPGWEVSLPKRVTRVPHEWAFDGRRMLVDMGITANEFLHARVVRDGLAFDHNIWALPLQHRKEWEAEVALGVLLSSLGRYFLSMTAGLWGVGHDQIRREQLVRLPLRLTSVDDPRVARVRAAVSQLSEAGQSSSSLFDQPAVEVGDLLREIDSGVFELFELADFERDLVEDHWLERESQRNIGPGLTSQRDEQSDPVFQRYADAFLETWEPLLGNELALDWRVYQDKVTASVAALFALRDVDAPLMQAEDDVAWKGLLQHLGGPTRDPAEGLRTFGMVRIVTDREIVLVKCDRPEMWTASAAREDAEATSVELTVRTSA